MKKTLLVTAILASLVPTAQATVNVYQDDAHQVDLYGRAYGAYIYQDGNDVKSDGRSDSYFRTGFKASSNLADDLTGLARIEMQFESRDNSDANSTSKTRLIYAGLKNDWGQLTFGRNYAADEIIADWADAGTTNYSGNPAIGNLNRQTNILKLETKVLDDALNLVAHIQPESSVDASNGNYSQSSYAFGGVYGFDFGLELGATYTGVMTEDYNANSDYDRSTVLVAARYKLKGLTASIVGDSTSVDTPNTAADPKDANDWTAYELSLAYSLDKLTGTFTYKQRDTDSFNDNTVDQAALGLAYKFNSNFRVVTEYVILDVADDEDQWHMAARYDF
ncbi:porin [Moritella yayanosii]|uniref:OmpU, outer membrane protein n=1 Tax=Moritella yayanosii TaxID=69539 RepID=A0A330LPN3_9GAMM|nr:porin [Moritella yayanosii]SQD78392.1 OmpU, outer membrane protein [Moritella yayanosii]